MYYNVFVKKLYVVSGDTFMRKMMNILLFKVFFNKIISRKKTNNNNYK